MSIKKGRLFTPLRVAAAVSLAVIAAVLLTWLYLQDKNIAVFNPQGIIASQQRDLILFTLLLSFVVVVPVFVMLGVFAWKYREGNTKSKYTPEVEGNRWLETIWWGIPIIIIGILGYVTVKSTHELDPYKPIVSDTAPLKVQVVALQWKWLFIYPEQKVASVNELRIPVGTPVDFEITADAPMSAFWIPNLGSQTYAMNGMTARLSLMADAPGSYRGTNTNINGEGYADMHFQAIAMEDRRTFDDWMSDHRYDEKYTDMNWKSYVELAKPGVEEVPLYYQVTEEALYEKIINKYMNHSGGGHNSSKGHGN